LIVAPGYARAAKRFGFEVYDLDGGFRRVHREAPEPIGELRGVCASPAAQRLFISGLTGLLAYSWPEKKLLWRRPVEGRNTEQNDAVTVTIDGARLYTVRHFATGMNVYDAATGDRLRVICEAEMRWGRFSQVSHDGKRLYACDKRDVIVLDASSEAVLARFTPVAEPVRFVLSADGSRVVYATGASRTLAVHDADGKLLHTIEVPPKEGELREKTPHPWKTALAWTALSPDGKQAWASDAENGTLHRFNLAANPPRYSGRVEVDKGTEGVIISVDGRFLVAGSGEVFAPGNGKSLGRLADEQGNPTKASNNMMALEVDAATGRILRANQQCAPVWPGPAAGVNEAASPQSAKEHSRE
jgi:DNA-binding beta-propeller fold protein YncE